jgi:hypothetical protein
MKHRTIKAYKEVKEAGIEMLYTVVKNAYYTLGYIYICCLHLQDQSE